MPICVSCWVVQTAVALGSDQLIYAAQQPGDHPSMALVELNSLTRRGWQHSQDIWLLCNSRLLTPTPVCATAAAASGTGLCTHTIAVTSSMKLLLIIGSDQAMCLRAIGPLTAAVFTL